MIRKNFTFPSAVGDCDIDAVAFLPEQGKPRAVIQMLHGMMEHIGRYEPFASFFVEQGYAVYGHSHLGHGASVNEKYPFGYFGRDNGAGRVFRADAFQMTDIIRNELPGVPIVLFGYSMGSFVCRACIGERGGDYAAAIVCATGGAHPELEKGLIAARLFSMLRPKAAGKTFNKMAFGSYNDRTEHLTKMDWLSPDHEYVVSSNRDPLVGFTFSNQGFYDLFTMIQHINSESIYRGTPMALPILLISGADDPVGMYGALVQDSYDRYLASGHADVHMKLYPGRRHEIHLDPGGKDVADDILEFLDKRI
ncbi:MAG: alpha/beta fold hydrolase [Oscillospiraceae bacterium]|nr:alpha/beta fold hydrolase [Oscillospiraceae bacterium]